MRTLLRKEAKEIWRTYRVWAIPVVFLFIGFSAPASTKFLPELLKPQLQAQGISITMPKLGAVAAYQAYFKNLTQIGLLAVILFSMGLISEEKTSGIMAQIVTKPVSRRAIVVSKWLVHGAWFVLSLVLGAVGCFFYTAGLFGKAPAGSFALANLVYVVYLVLIFTLTLAAGAALRNQVAVSVVGLMGFSALSLVSFFSKTLADYSPAALSGLASSLVSNQARSIDALAPAVIALVLAGGLLAAGVFVFDRQEL